MLAQVGANSILYFTTDNYVVNVFTEGNQTLMNVYDATNDVTRLRRGPVQRTILGNRSVYVSTGSFSGRQARYQVIITGERQATLLIEDGSGEEISREEARTFQAFRVPEDVVRGIARNEVLVFETATYAVRVFSRGENRFMNVFHRRTAETEVNGQPANVAPRVPPYEQTLSYVSSGERDGQPVEYFARIDGSGATLLEIYNINGRRIFQEPGQGPVIINIPDSDLAGLRIGVAENAYVAAVFEDSDALSAIQSLYPEAFMDEARQGSFINAGAFQSRDAATIRVLELRRLGYNARVIYRDVEYR